MRQIKFRAWHIEDKNYEYLDDDVKDGLVLSLPSCKVFDVSEYPDYTGGGMVSVDVSERYMLEQYTGLKDKNGTEIYEGDIITRGLDGNFLVQYKHDSYYIGYVATMDDSLNSYIHLWYDGIEIVGNIHENPELMEAK